MLFTGMYYKGLVILSQSCMLTSECPGPNFMQAFSKLGPPILNNKGFCPQ